MYADTDNKTVCGGQVLTATTGNFLRVSAQMRKLDKQKTASSRKTLGVIAADIPARQNMRLISLNIFLIILTSCGDNGSTSEIKSTQWFERGNKNDTVMDTTKKTPFIQQDSFTLTPAQADSLLKFSRQKK